MTWGFARRTSPIALPRQPPNRPVLYIDGNHDHDPWYRGLETLTEMGPNLIFVPRGTVLELDRRRVAFLGGGDSVIDRAQRSEGGGLVARRASHGAGRGSGERGEEGGHPRVPHPSGAGLSQLGLRPDPSSQAVERVWEMLGRPATVCGHLHRARAVGRVRVLAELEVFLM